MEIRPLIDSHAHLDGEDFVEDLPEVLARAKDAGVEAIVNIGATDQFDGALRTLKLADSQELGTEVPELWCSIGIHPHDAKIASDKSRLIELSQHPKVRAIGETGLDFFKEWSPKEDQYRWFRLQIEIAHERQLPLIIHSREAGAECLKVLQEMEAEKVGGVFHCFAEDATFAVKLREMNFLVSFPGILTFPKAKAVQEAAKEIPLEQIMVETDAPYLAPVPFRGKRCESAFVRNTALTLAEIKGISFEEVAKQTTATAKKFYKIP
ncbi:MAG: TatD family hydrolase [Bdellovibrionales bacterium]|nr:TatD family hydrolase [Bdellovibrionales bacterium]